MIAAAEGNFDNLKSIISSGGKDGSTEVSVKAICLQNRVCMAMRHWYHSKVGHWTKYVRTKIVKSIE